MPSGECTGTTDRPTGGNTGRLFLTFGGPVCADRISYCPLDRVLTYKNLIYLLNLQFFAEIVLSGTVFKIQTFSVCDFCEKFKIAAIFWQVKYLLKLGKASLHRYLVDQQFLPKLHGFKIEAFF